MSGATKTAAHGSFDRERIAVAYVVEGLTPRYWTSAAHDLFGQHSHAQHKVLHCLRGSIVFTIVESGAAIELAPGDRLDLPAGVEHSAIVGAYGCECVEAYR